MQFRAGLVMIIAVLAGGSTQAMTVPKFPFCGKEIAAALGTDGYSGSVWYQTAGAEPAAGRALAPKSQVFRSNPVSAKKQSVHVDTGHVVVTEHDYKKLKTASYKISKDGCQKQSTESGTIRKPTSEQQTVFDDQSIYAILDSGITTIVYTWSPYMPLSFTGIPNIRNAAKFVGAQVLIIVDPTADPAHVEKAMKGRQMRAEWKTPWESDELRVRGFGLHYPTAILLHKGKISQAYAGHKSVEGFVKWAKHEIVRMEKK